MTAGTGVDLQRLSDLLWAERASAREAVHSAVVASSVRAVDHRRRAAMTLARALETTTRRAGERERVQAEVAAAHGLPPGAALDRLSAALPEPWATIVDEHRGALARLAHRLGSAVEDEAVRRLVHAWNAAVGDSAATWTLDDSDLLESPEAAELLADVLRDMPPTTLRRFLD